MSFNDWKHGIFDCTRQTLELNICGFFPLFVPFFITNIAARLNSYAFGLGFTSMLVLTCLCGYINYGTSIAMEYVTNETADMILAIIGALFGGVLFYVFYSIRTRMREKLAIAGDGFYDCIVSFFCSCCSMVQMAAEVDLEHVHICDPPEEYELSKL